MVEPQFLNFRLKQAGHFPGIHIHVDLSEAGVGPGTRQQLNVARDRNDEAAVCKTAPHARAETAGTDWSSRFAVVAGADL